MARLEGSIQFTGKLGDFIAYKRSDSDRIIIRLKGGPTAERVKEAPEYINTRRNNSEFSGRSKASKWVRRAIRNVLDISDYAIAGVLTGRMIRAQREDEQSEWGKRNVLLSKTPQLLEGFPLNRRINMETLISSPLRYQLSRKERSAPLQLPQLIPGLSFHPRKDFPLYQISVVLAVVPDLFYHPVEYAPAAGYDYHQFKTWDSAWHATAKGSDAETVDLKLDLTLPDQHHSLVLVVALRYGRMLGANEVQVVKRIGAGKIVGVV